MALAAQHDGASSELDGCTGMLLETASAAVGLSGRALRRLPFMAAALYSGDGALSHGAGKSAPDAENPDCTALLKGLGHALRAHRSADAALQTHELGGTATAE